MKLGDKAEDGQLLLGGPGGITTAGNFSAPVGGAIQLLRERSAFGPHRVGPSVGNAGGGRGNVGGGGGGIGKWRER